jgi:DNA-directed RNA polymerase
MTLREDVRRQLDLEDESRSLGVVRYQRSRPLPWRSHEDSLRVEEEANLPPGKHLLRLAVEPTAEAIREFITKASSGAAGRRFSALGWMELADPEEVAYLTVRIALNEAVVGASLQTVAMRVAAAIIDHVEMVLFKEKNPAGYKGLMRRQAKVTRGSQKRREAVRKLLEKEESRLLIEPRIKILLGSKALELMIEATGLFTEELTWKGKGKKLYVLRPTETVQKWLTEQHARSALVQPLLMPMVVRPKPWRSPTSGGYRRRLVGRGLVKSADPDYQAKLRTADLSLVYEAVNHIQATPWRINRRVLEVMQEVWDSGGRLGGLPSREDEPLPPKPWDIETNEAAKVDWKRRAKLVHEANGKLFAKRLSVNQALWQAVKFGDEKEIWFPHSLDFRGRAYPLPSSGLSPQADDIGKSLLEFAHGKLVGPTGGYWLAVHVANLWGQGKLSFKDRIKWTYDHAAQIIDSAVDPLDGARFWAEADHPWMALAAAIDFAGYVAEGDTYVSHLPVAVDGSNSGLQHFSAMFRDPVGGAAVNLTPSAAPQDVYAQVAEVVQSVVDASDDPDARPWKGGKVTRDLTKRPTMTFVYSATRFGMQDMILQTLQEIDARNAAQGRPPHLEGSDNYAAAGYLSYVLFEAISKVVPVATEAMGWLGEAAKIANKAGTSLTWTTPDGLPVMQNYREPVGTRLTIHWRGRLLTLTVNQTGTKIARRSQVSSIAPNFIHSMDAAHLRAVVRAAKAVGIQHLAVIHDSFATHAADMDRLVDILKGTFVDQYGADVVSRFRSEIVEQLPPGLALMLPQPPARGALDIEDVRASEYLFA